MMTRLDMMSVRLPCGPTAFLWQAEVQQNIPHEDHIYR